MGGFLSTSSQTSLNPQTEKPNELTVEPTKNTVAIETDVIAPTTDTKEKPVESHNINTITDIVKSEVITNNIPVPDNINNNPSEVFERHVDQIGSKVSIDPVKVYPNADVTKKNKNKNKHKKNKSNNKSENA